MVHTANNPNAMGMIGSVINTFKYPANASATVAAVAEELTAIRYPARNEIRGHLGMAFFKY